MSATPSTPEEDRRAEAERDDEVLFLLFSSPYPWSVDELARELDDACAPDRVARLAAAGLVYRLGEFVFPTRAARRARELYRPY
jgi:predicted transcriptional regulator